MDSPYYQAGHCRCDYVRTSWDTDISAKLDRAAVGRLKTWSFPFRRTVSLAGRPNALFARDLAGSSGYSCWTRGLAGIF